jgi:hypothetical protein
MFPFKDDFWTTSKPQPGCKFSSCVEPNPVLETLVAALSTGPVGPSDSIGNLDVELIMHTCTKSGLLLKADKPATALDSTFLPQKGFSFPSLIQVWDSFTQFGKNRWHYLLAADLVAPFTVTTTDIVLQGTSSIVFDYFHFTNGTHTVTPFDDTHSLKIANQKTTETAAGSVVPFNYYVIAPILQSKWVLLGEVNKFITVSHQRITSLTDTSSSLSFTIAGTQGESIELFLYYATTSAFTTLSPTFTSNTITITCTTKCTQSSSLFKWSNSIYPVLSRWCTLF